MKRLLLTILLLGWIATAVQAASPSTTAVTVAWSDFTADWGLFTNRLSYITPVSPGRPDGSGRIVTGDRRPFTNSSTAAFTVMLTPGDYKLESVGPYRTTSLYITVPTSPSASYDAADIITYSTNLTNGATAYSTTTSDTRFIRADTNHVLAGYHTNFLHSNIVASGSITLSVTNGHKLVISSSTNSGEANTIGNAGSTNTTDRFGLAGGKSGVSVLVKTLSEGSNVTITDNGTNLVLASTGGGTGSTTGTNFTIQNTTNTSAQDIITFSDVSSTYWNPVYGVRATNYAADSFSLIASNSGKIGGMMWMPGQGQYVFTDEDYVACGVDLMPGWNDIIAGITNSTCIIRFNSSDPMKILDNTTREYWTVEMGDLYGMSNAYIKRLMWVTNTLNAGITTNFPAALSVSNGYTYFAGIPLVATNPLVGDVLSFTNGGWSNVTRWASAGSSWTPPASWLITNATAWPVASTATNQISLAVRSVSSNLSDVFQVYNRGDQPALRMSADGNALFDYGVDAVGLLQTWCGISNLIGDIYTGGDVFATAYHGDGSALTGISGTSASKNTNVVWFAVIPGGGAGTGTESDPYNAWGATSFAATTNFDIAMSNLLEAEILGTTALDIRLAPGTYYTHGYSYYYKPYQLKSNVRLRGSGIDRTIVQHYIEDARFVDDTIWHVFASESQLDAVTIEEMTIDCGATNLTARTGYTGATVECIHLFGDDITIRNVKVINWGCIGSPAIKGWVVAISANGANNYNALLDGVIVSDPYYNQNTFAPICLNIIGENGGVMHNAIIRNCTVRGYTAEQESLIGGLQIENCADSMMVGNVMEGTYYGITQNALTNFDIIVRNNHFRDVRFGMQLSTHTNTSIGTLIVENNCFWLDPSTNSAVASRALQLDSDAAFIRATNLIFRDNFISLGTYGIDNTNQSQVMWVSNIANVAVYGNQIASGFCTTNIAYVIGGCNNVEFHNNTRIGSTNLPYVDGAVYHKGLSVVGTNLADVVITNTAAAVAPLLIKPKPGTTTAKNFDVQWTNGQSMVWSSNTIPLVIKQPIGGGLVMDVLDSNSVSVFYISNSTTVISPNSTNGTIIYTNGNLIISGIYYGDGSGLTNVSGGLSSTDVTNIARAEASTALVSSTNFTRTATNGFIGLAAATNVALAQANLALESATNFTRTATNGFIGLQAATNVALAQANLALESSTNFTRTATNGFIGLTAATNVSLAQANLALESATNFTRTATNGFIGLTTATNVADFRITNVVYRTVWIDAGAMRTNSAGSPSAGTYEYPLVAGGIVSDTWDFDGSNAETNHFKLAMPEEWDGGTVKAKIHWTQTFTNANNGVVWGLSGINIGPAGYLTNFPGFGTEVSCTNACGETNSLHVATNSVGITLGGLPTTNGLAIFQIRRIPGDGGDTMAADARLLGVQLQYKINKHQNTVW